MIISAVTEEILHIYIICMTVVILMRRSVYFLNICYIRVFYRFNRNRALHKMVKILCFGGIFGWK
jgi:hypothetical protein